MSVAVSLYPQHEYESDWTIELLKIILPGEYGVGKTSLLARFYEDQDLFSSLKFPNLRMPDWRCRCIKVDQQRVKLQLWDTADQERFGALSSQFYRGAKLALLVFDATNKESFDRIPFWMNEVKKEAPPNVYFTLVGNKNDLAQERIIGVSTAQCFADEHNIPYVETCAKNLQSVEDAFLLLLTNYFMYRKSHPELEHAQDTIDVKVTNTNSESTNSGSWSCFS